MSPPPMKNPIPPIQSPPPMIRVTHTESQLVKKSESNDNLVDAAPTFEIKPPTPMASKPSSPVLPKSDAPSLPEPVKSDEEQSSDAVVHADDPAPLVAGVNSPPKVIKRKAPTPSAPDGSQAGDISVSRPVAAKPQPGQGMLPPPPSKEDSTPATSTIPVLSTTPATPLPAHKNLGATPKQSPPTPVPPPIAPKPQSPPEVPPKVVSPPPTVKVELMSEQLSEVTSSTEQLIGSGGGDPSADAARAASSPTCLRPINKIADVKTIKRQPKSGWL